MPKTVTVALRKESVDRNNTVQIVIVVVHASLSARRAWIEIRRRTCHKDESQSLSARRAWIEIHTLLGGYYNVACRSPQGERG